jgi:apolipoprotein N-acyltransferase
LLAVGGGLAGALAFEPVGWLPLAPLAPLLAFVAVRQAPTAGAAFRRTLVFGWVFYFGAVQWLTTIGNYAPMPLLAGLGIGLLALYMALYPALGVYALRRWLWRPGPGTQFALFACVWLLAEWLRTLGRLAMPLAQLGHAWAVWPLAIQPAQFLGELGVSLEILWLAGLLFYWGLYAWVRWRGGTSERDRAAAPDLPSIGRGLTATLFFPVLVLACLLLLKTWDARLDTFAAKPQAQSLRVALLQPNIDQPVKLASYAYPYSDVQALLRDAITTIEETMLAGLSRPAWDGLMARLTVYPPQGEAYRRAFFELRDKVREQRSRLPVEPRPLDADLVILPETAFSEIDFTANRPLEKRVGRMAARAGAPLLTGAGRIEGTGDAERIFNSAFLVERDGRLAPALYDKIRLVPFGECLPYFDVIPGFQENIVGIGAFTEGRRYTLFEVRGQTKDGRSPQRPLRLGVLICFESTFSAMARRFAGEGADLLAVITNDAWYGRSAGAAAHHHLSLLRAVETRRLVLRCANTGISSVIAPTGRVLAALPLGQAGLLRAFVTPKTDEGTTLFTRVGNAWLALPAALLAWAGWANRRRRGDATVG